MEWIGQLYDIEDQARELSAEARLSFRQQQSIPVLDQIEHYLAELSPRALPKGTLAKAVSYAQNQWQAIGRKNWMFLGSPEAGPRAAILYTVLAGAKRHRIEPWTLIPPKCGN